MPEFTDDDFEIIQSMMRSNTKDMRNPYAAVPPQIVTPMRSEQALTELPSSAMSAADQQAFMNRDAEFHQDDLQGMSAARFGEEGKGPHPLSPKLVAIIRDAISRPDLRQFRRPMKSLPMV